MVLNPHMVELADRFKVGVLLVLLLVLKKFLYLWNYLR